MKKATRINAPKLYVYTYSNGRPHYEQVNPWWWKLRNLFRGYAVK